jgi:hypothetical protein
MGSHLINLAIRFLFGSRQRFRRVVAIVILAWKHVRQLRLVHLVHQFLDFIGAHRHAADHAHFQRHTHDEHTKPLDERHGIPHAWLTRPKGRPSGDGSGYARPNVDGGARERTRERSATGCSSQHEAMRRMTTTATAGNTSHSGTRIALPRVVARAGTKPAKTTIAMQMTATARRVLGLVFTANPL